MPKPKEEYLYILVTNRGFLAPLQMVGPVVRPIKVAKKIARDLIMRGCDVYEYIPYSKQTVKLTPENLNDPHRLDGVEINPPKPKEPVSFTVPNPEPEKTIPDPEEDSPEMISSKEAVVETVEENYAPTSVEEYVFELNEDGTVNEQNIVWANFADKDERRAIRARINEINKAAREKAAEEIKTESEPASAEE